MAETSIEKGSIDNIHLWSKNSKAKKQEMTKDEFVAELRKKYNKPLCIRGLTVSALSKLLKVEPVAAEPPPEKASKTVYANYITEATGVSDSLTRIELSELKLLAEGLYEYSNKSKA